MRTVSFSTASVRRTLNSDFVCHAINTEGDPSAGKSHAHAPTDRPGRCSEGVANQNVQLLFLTPKRQIFHTVSGFRQGVTLHKELLFAKALFEKIQKSPSDAETIVRTEHTRHFGNSVAQRQRGLHERVPEADNAAVVVAEVVEASDAPSSSTTLSLRGIQCFRSRSLKRTHEFWSGTELPGSKPARPSEAKLAAD